MPSKESERIYGEEQPAHLQGRPPRAAGHCSARGFQRARSWRHRASDLPTHLAAVDDIAPVSTHRPGLGSSQPAQTPGPRASREPDAQRLRAAAPLPSRRRSVWRARSRCHPPHNVPLRRRWRPIRALAMLVVTAPWPRVVPSTRGLHAEIVRQREPMILITDLGEVSGRGTTDRARRASTPAPSGPAGPAPGKILATFGTGRRWPRSTWPRRPSTGRSTGSVAST